LFVESTTKSCGKKEENNMLRIKKFAVIAVLASKAITGATGISGDVGALQPDAIVYESEGLSGEVTSPVEDSIDLSIVDVAIAK
jgi:hypothetical protein